MREVIVTDLTRFSTDENVCIAVIDVNTGENLLAGAPKFPQSAALIATARN